MTAPGSVPDTLADRPAGATDELSVAECWQLLGEAVVGRLAVIVAGEPDIFPVNHVVDHGTVVFRSGSGTKVVSALHGVVAFEADGYDLDGGSAWSVVVRGRTVEIGEKQEKVRALDLPLSPWQAGSKPRLLRIEPTSVSGRRVHLATASP